MRSVRLGEMQDCSISSALKQCLNPMHWHLLLSTLCLRLTHHYVYKVTSYTLQVYLGVVELWQVWGAETLRQHSAQRLRLHLVAQQPVVQVPTDGGFVHRKQLERTLHIKW